MPKHTTVEDTIHSFESHAPVSVSWQGSTVINTYDKTEHSSVEFVGRISNGTDSEMLRISMLNDSSDNTGIDVYRLAISTYLNLDISSAVVGDDVQLTIENTEATEDNTLSYYVIPLI